MYRLLPLFLADAPRIGMRLIAVLSYCKSNCRAVVELDSGVNISSTTILDPGVATRFEKESWSAHASGIHAKAANQNL
jgi:hypothetical protein